MFVYILFACVALLFIRLLFNVFGTGLSAYPGPWLAKVTDLWRLKQVVDMRQPWTYRKLHDKHGFVVRVGPNAVSVSDPALIDRICGHKNDLVKSDYVKPWTPIRNGKLTPGLVDAQDKKVHAEMKRPIASTYSMTNIVTAEPLVNNTITYFLKQLDDRFVKTKQACDIDRWVQYYAFDVMGELTFSRRLGFLEKGSDVDGILADLDIEFDYRAIIGQTPWLDKFLWKNPLYLWFSKPSSLIAGHAMKHLQARKESPPPGSDRDMYARFQEAKKAHPDIVDDSKVLRFIMTNLLAGSDTTALVLRTVIYYTLKNKNIRSRLQAELDNANLSYPVSWKQAQTLPYLDAVIKEALRIHPVPGFNVERIVPREGLLLSDGRRLPAGTIVSMTAWTLHFDPVFGEDRETFNPDRWLQRKDESHEDWQRRLKAMNRADFAFSYGPRVCIGRHIATLEMYKLIPTLFGLLDMELVNPHKPWKVEPRFFAKQSEMDITLRWREGVNVHDIIGAE
ncbi:MAG: hypothetical protein Q9227_000802 [Pyrenula ochraceoflavens]